jgi:NAD(P)-dependent dehydrogenase (short-subunit alcohol dehydrogenase family)
MTLQDRNEASARPEPEVVLITGASAGIGRATVRRFAAEGAHIGLLARGRAGLEAAKREAEAAGGRAVVLQADVADAGVVEAAAETLEREFGPIDVWVNNAFFRPALLPLRQRPHHYEK